MAAEDRDLNREDRELNRDERRDLNRDPITDEPGAHPIGTGVGAAGGAVAGAAAGAIGGPIGVAVGGVVGAVVGGLAGKAAAEAVNPTAEEAHWRENYTREPYYEQGRSFDDYGPAYRLGVTSRTRDQGDWTAAEPRLASEWESSRGTSSLDWEQARPASRAAWERIDNRMSGTGDQLERGGSLAASGNRMNMDPGTMSMSDGTGRRMEMSGSGMAMSGDSTAPTATTGRSGGTGTRGAAAKVGEMQSAGDNKGDRDDVIDVLKDLVETCFDGEYGFRTCADQAKRQDLKSLFMQRAEDCRRGAQELAEQIHALGGKVADGGSAMGAVERGWVAVRATLSTFDDKAVLEECERGEDNALARYRKALQKPLPADIKLIVERQLQGVQRNHDQIKMLRNQFRAAS
ncbi:PA2169 family four-helix-bundle protein [Ramlibacter sp.]|uniref:ferritin-like domain-containing protein n=1 Tax=Ramlibacter sp. TaxID=1917967 RepID=UPI002BBAE3DA|nr:PA2169 family four-helix-bundle protein [Ramlibacter sp.]HWI84622.1 PA2169 family four-helix-bundle protein [Ramlibacter sp.]